MSGLGISAPRTRGSQAVAASLRTGGPQIKVRRPRTNPLCVRRIFWLKSTLLHGSAGLSVLGWVVEDHSPFGERDFAGHAGLGCSPPGSLRAANLAEQSQMGGCSPHPQLP